MDNKEKVIIPLTIGAAVLGIWAALRRTPSAPTTYQGGNVNFPGVPPLQQTLFGLSSDYAFPSPGAGTGAGSSYAVRAADNPYSVSPGANINLNAGFNPASYLQFNVDPWSDLKKAYARADSAPAGSDGSHGGCGCGGCNGGSGNGTGGVSAALTAKCGQTRNPRLMDGHGDCLTTRPKFPMLKDQNAAMRFIAESYDVGFLATGSDYGIADAGKTSAAGGY